LCGRRLLGIFFRRLKGKPCPGAWTPAMAGFRLRKGGDAKATGLQQRAMTAGLPAKRKFFREGVSWHLEARKRGSRRLGETAESDGLARALVWLRDLLSWDSEHREMRYLPIAGNRDASMYSELTA